MAKDKDDIAELVKSSSTLYTGDDSTEWSVVMRKCIEYIIYSRWY